MEFLTIIPVYNEENNILNTITSVKSYSNNILIVNDASTDNTKDMIKGCKTITNPKNMGKGFSLRKGFEYALKNNYDAMIILDGDGEHNPYDIPLFLEKIKDADIVIGERNLFRSKKREFLNFFSSFWTNIILKDIKDSQCGFRAVRTELLKKMNLKSNGFEIELEMLLEAIKHKARIKTVNIQTKPTRKSGVKFKDYLKINKLFDKWIIENYKYLKLSLVKKIVLLSFSYIGLKASNIILRK